MARLFSVLLAAILPLATTGLYVERRLAQQPGGATPENNFNPATITVQGGSLVATPITPNAPYPQNNLQCNVSGDSRIPQYSTFPLTLLVPRGQMVRVIFANGNLNGSTVTQQGEPGVIAQQNGSAIVQQSGSASPIVQSVGSPVVQQAAPPAALVVQQGPTTVVQQPTYQTAATVTVSQPPPSPPSSPPPSPTPTPSGTTVQSTRCGTVSVGGVNVNVPCPNGVSGVSVQLPTLSLPALGVLNIGRKMLQDTVPGGPNNGLVEYVALGSANSVPGFVVPNTQFGVPYVEFSSTDAASGQTATFAGALEVANVVGGVPQFPFTRNANLSPSCEPLSTSNHYCDCHNFRVCIEL